MIYEQDGFNRIDNLVYEEQPGRVGNVAYSDSLEHHGIAGQKWGVRHGPPYPLVSGGKNVHLNVGKMTEKTKQAYKKTKAKVGGVIAVRKQKAAAKKAEKENEAKNISDVGPKKFVKSKQRISDMSSEELKARIERLKLEEEYRKYLNGGQSQQQKAANGKAKADSILHDVGKTVATNLATTAVKIIGDKQLAKNQMQINRRKSNQEIEIAARKAERVAYRTDMAKQMAKEHAEIRQYEHDRRMRERKRRDYNEDMQRAYNRMNYRMRRDEESRARNPRLMTSAGNTNYESYTPNYDYYQSRHGRVRRTDRY